MCLAFLARFLNAAMSELGLAMIFFLCKRTPLGANKDDLLWRWSLLSTTDMTEKMRKILLFLSPDTHRRSSSHVP